MVKKIGVLAGLALVALMLLVAGGSALAAPPGPAGAGAGFGFLDRVTLQRVATLLGTTPADVTAQLQQGKSLLQVAQSKSVSEQALTDSILQPIKDRMAVQLKYGYVTQEQADLALQNQQARIKALLSATPGANGNTGAGYGGCHGAAIGGPGGMMGGFGGMMGGFGGMTGGSGGMMGGFSGTGAAYGRGMMTW